MHGIEHLFGRKAAVAIPDVEVDGPVRLDIDNLVIGFDAAVASITGFIEFPDILGSEPLDTATVDLTIELNGFRALVDNLRDAKLLNTTQFIGVRACLELGKKVEDDVLRYRIDKLGLDQFNVNWLPIGWFFQIRLVITRFLKRIAEISGFPRNDR